MAKILILVALAACSIGVESQSDDCVQPEDLDGSDYRGTVSTTDTGNICQKWTSQSPNLHNRTTENYPESGLGDHNYCRNPDGGHGPWCYNNASTSPRWEYCDVLTCGCEAEYFASVGTTGHLSSINYPQDYDLTYECGSVITASSGQTIRLDFSFFDVEYKYDCSWDGLEIRDGDNISSPLIGKYCGNSTGSSNSSTPGVIESSGSALYLYFKSDDEQTEAGYTATFEAFGDVSENCWIQHEKTKYKGTILATVYSAEHVLAVCDKLNCVAYSCHAKPEKKGCNIYSEISGESSKRASKKWTSHVQGPCEV